MNDNDGKKTLGVRSGPRAGNVKQSFSHGRSKNVVVETKRKRVVVPKAGTSKTTIQSSYKEGAKNLSSGITDTEMERRLKALQAAKAREADEVAQREANAKEREQGRRPVSVEQRPGTFTLQSSCSRHDQVPPPNSRPVCGPRTECFRTGHPAGHARRGHRSGHRGEPRRACGRIEGGLCRGQAGPGPAIPLPDGP